MIGRSMPPWSRLPDQLGSELNLTRTRRRRREQARVGIGRTGRIEDIGTGYQRRHLEVHTIEQIEELGPEL